MSKFIKNILHKCEKALKGIGKRQSVVWSALIAVCSFVIVGFVIAWSNPSVNPPGGNIPAPINVSTTTQTKLGKLNLMDNVGINTTSPVTYLNIVGTTDSGPSTHGLFVLGGSETSNLSMDQNEIMARNNGTTSPLYLNNDGGNLFISTAGDGSVGIGTTTVGSVPGSLYISGGTNICNLVTYTATSGTTLCPSGFYTWSGLASTTGQILCCKVSNPI